ncbi:hypothetical protein [Pectobacterium polaris]|uniref:hypothetical protein n=1 Tax=Pectobacterium polaris TaxID=2042057 RepID=UPI001CF0E51F|nr:hypothetical protein [Pectobacterium polaris]MCA6954803.1 hypothetical protein [Pectobacterium polaris]
MKPEMSTAVMIERLRALASESQDSVLLSSAASRIELLLAAESGMSREMACIRHALDIPPDQSIHSGVVNECVRLNAKIQDLSGQLSKPEPVYQYQSEIYNEDSGETELYWNDCDIGFYSQYAEDWRRILYSAPVPQAVSQTVKPIGFIEEKAYGTDTYTLKCFYRPNGTTDLVGQKVYVAQPASQTYTVPDEINANQAYDILSSCEPLMSPVDAGVYMWNACRAAMLQPSSNSPSWIGIDWAKNCEPVISALTAENLALKEIIDHVTDLDNEPQYHESGMGCGLEDKNITDRYEAMQHGWDAAMERVYSEVIPCAEELSFPATEQAARELMAKGVDQAASGFHEKAFAAFEGSNEPGLYIRAQLQLLAQQLRDGEA